MGDLILHVSIAALAYTYFGYPIILMFWTIVKPIRHGVRLAATSSRPNSVSVVVAACNSESHIEEKLRNTIAAAQCAKLPVQILVCSDGSTDRTDELVSSFANAGVQLIRISPRAGKERSQIQAVAASSGDIIVFTDSRTMLNEDAIANMLDYFSNPAIGAISSVDVVPWSGEGLYVRYEMWLRRLETHANSLVGLSGSCFAVRKELARFIEEDIPSDFCLMLQAQRLGLKGISATDVRCHYGVTTSASREYARKVRTVLRGLTALSRHRDLLSPRQFGFFAIQLISHKLLRWLAPFFILSMISGALVSGLHSVASTLVLAGAILIAALAALGWTLPSTASSVFVRIPTFFVVSNAAIMTAWYSLVSGQRMETWEPSQA